RMSRLERGPSLVGAAALNGLRMARILLPLILSHARSARRRYVATARTKSIAWNAPRITRFGQALRHALVARAEACHRPRMSTSHQPRFLDVDGRAIAFRRRDGKAPGLVWLGGYRSDMKGTKAEALDRWAEETGRAFLRHDYSGHGESGGAFEDGTISRWLAQSLAIFRSFTQGRQILVGSSMGAWIALRMAQELRRAGEERIAGLVLLAPAPDFTAELVEPALTDAQRRALAENGYFEEPSYYADQ